MTNEKQYDLIASSYSLQQQTKNNVARKAFYDAIDFPLDNQRVLDAGCGDGQDIAYFTKLGARVYGIDSSSKMADIAQKANPNALVICKSMCDTGFESGFFDTIFSKYSVQHESDVDSVLIEFSRILKPGGTMLLLVTHPLTHFLANPKKNYFNQETINLTLFGNGVTVTEPSHTISDFISPTMLEHFEIQSVTEGNDPAIDPTIQNTTYPGFMIIKAVKKSVKQRDFDTAQIFEKEIRNGLKILDQISQPKITIFGSHRPSTIDTMYKHCETLSYRLGKMGYAILSGGGSGIMSAANNGATKANAPSIGFKINHYPNEHSPDSIFTHDLSFQYFATRKQCLNISSAALIFYPGGVGTLDELFEILVLLKTKTIHNVPVICVNRKYWEGLFEWLGKHTHKQNTDLVRFADTHEEIENIIEESMNNN